MDPERITPKQALAARLLLGWTQSDAAEKASITAPSVSEAEYGNRSDVIAARLRAAYEAAGIEFTNRVQPGVRLRTEEQLSDDILMRELDVHQIWTVRDCRSPVPANRTNLRAALKRAKELTTAGKDVTSVHTRTRTIWPAQILRLWGRLEEAASNAAANRNAPSTTDVAVVDTSPLIEEKATRRLKRAVGGSKAPDGHA